MKRRRGRTDFARRKRSERVSERGRGRDGGADKLEGERDDQREDRQDGALCCVFTKTHLCLQLPGKQVAALNPFVLSLNVCSPCIHLPSRAISPRAIK